jgi:hypothetical protein
MEPLFYVMAILGCGDGSTGCSEQRVVPARFATVQQCNAAMPGLLERNADIDFPVVSAACRANRATLVDAGRAARSRG